MITVPINLPGDQRSILLIVIERENLDRMKKADPITLESGSLGGLVMPLVKYPANLSLLIAYEEDDVELYSLARKNDVFAIVEWLERGKVFDPKMDGPENVIKL